MIDTTKLTACGLAISKNEWLRFILGTAKAYNNLGRNDKSERINVLDRLLALVGEWITSDPPRATRENTARWAAMGRSGRANW